MEGLVMSRKHIVALMLSFVYLAVVGFTDIPVNPSSTQYVELPLTPLPDNPKQQTPTFFNMSLFVEQDQAITAITKKYKRVSYDTAVKLVYTVYEESLKQQVDPKLILALIATESSFNPNSLSNKGAKGYTQVIPKWHRDKILNRDIWDVKVNIEVGVKVLKDCFRRNKTEYSALACYNGATTPDKAIAYKQAIDKHKHYFIAAVKQNNWG